MPGWARIDKVTGQILSLSEPPFTSPAPDGQQDVQLDTDATSFANQKLGGQPTQWKLDPTTLQVSHEFYDKLRDVKASLAASDVGMARVTEDLIDALMKAGKLSWADLPASVQQTIDQRKQLRAELS